MRLYHRTTAAAAAQIWSTGRFVSKENTGDVYFSTLPEGYASGYGDAVVCVNVPDEIAQLDDWFPGTGEEHYRVRAALITAEMIERPS